VTYSLEGPEAAGVLESTVLTADDRKATNAEDHERIRPAHIDNVKIRAAGSRASCCRCHFRWSESRCGDIIGAVVRQPARSDIRGNRGLFEAFEHL